MDGLRCAQVLPARLVWGLPVSADASLSVGNSSRAEDNEGSMPNNNT